VLQELQLKLTLMEGGEEGVATLLSLLPKRQHSQPAASCGTCCCHKPPWVLSKPPVLAVMTWSHKLHWHSAGQQLTQLTDLHLLYCTPMIGAVGLQRLVSRCPCLHTLTL
jgi:hypothetical protein